MKESPTVIRMTRDRSCLICRELVLFGTPGTIVMCGNISRAVHEHCIPRYMLNKARREENALKNGGKAGGYHMYKDGRVIRKANHL